MKTYFAKVYVVYSSTSGKASEAARELRARGFEAEVLGGIWGARLFVATTGDDYMAARSIIYNVVRHIIAEAVEIDRGVVDY